MNFLPPLSDLFYSDPYRALRENIQFGFYVGLGDIDGTQCRHVAFVDRNVDWQAWIEDGPQPTPRKVSIEYRSLPGQPRFSAVFSNWNFAPRIAEPVFTAEVPPDAKKIPFFKVPISVTAK
jgi:hypothetical protein